MGNIYYLLVSIGVVCSFMSKLSSAADSITTLGSLRDGQSLISPRGRFELGFFSPGNSNNRYLGIWFKNIPVKTVVWEANRNVPINDTSGVMMINKDSGGLDILSHNGAVHIWSSNSSRKADSTDNLILHLLDSGNLVLRDANSNENESDSYLWQSFDYPTDTTLSGMKFGWDLRTGLNRRFTAWKSPDDPSPGDLYRQLELHAWPELTMWKGSKKLSRSGPWNGVRFSGTPDMKANSVYDFQFVFNKDEVYYIYHDKNESVITMSVMNETASQTNRYIWDNADKRWNLLFWFPRDHCDIYGVCGAYGICNMVDSPVCQCLKGFEPKSPGKWENGDWSDGCVRSKPLNYSTNDGFMKFRGVKLPDTEHTWLNQSMNLKECRAKCLKNQSCMAYTQSDIRNGGSGCAFWTGDLIDITQLPISDQDLYIRMSSSEPGVEHALGVKKLSVILVVSIFVLLVMIAAIGFFLYGRRVKSTEKRGIAGEHHIKDKDLDLPLFDLATIVKATNNFSPENKLGQGGFGSVYKGMLEDGQEIAVKRLSHSSGQGKQEFMNEVKLIAKLQHRNLVKLHGCCLGGEEKMLVYEYLPNKSLDQFIFDETKRKLLSWPDRFCIICGIARGLLYLHQDSRLRIIHRDLKASNVLLDDKMNAKISDFGMAKAVGGDQIEGSTTRVVGTYGYMAPEYANDGHFSIKSDVFSFGILLLEIISGKKNRGFYQPERRVNLIEHAWELWNEKRPKDFVDQFLIESCNVMEVVRCIHIGLLCVQQHPMDRPSMSYVVQMLANDNELPQPNPPAFLIERRSSKSQCDTTESASSKLGSLMYEITDTPLEGR